MVRPQPGRFASLPFTRLLYAAWASFDGIERTLDEAATPPVALVLIATLLAARIGGAPGSRTQSIRDGQPYAPTLRTSSFDFRRA